MSDPDAILKVIHEGTLDIAGHRLRVYTLEDGSRVINADDVAEFFGGEILPEETMQESSNPADCGNEKP